MIFQGNWVDLLILLGTLIFVIDGARAGLISGILEFLGFIISLVAALIFFSQAAAIFTTFFAIPESIALAFGFLLVWFLTETIYFFLARFIFSKIPQNLLSSSINSLTGVLPAALNGLLLFAFLLTLFTALPIPANLKSAIFASEIGNFLVLRTNQLEKPLQQVFAPAVSDIQKSLTFLTVVPESRQSVNLTFTQQELRLDAASEAKMLELVNAARTGSGLRALTQDSALQDVARAHSRDMFQRGYFSHYSPEGADAGDRLTNAGVGFLLAGENLAFAPDVVRAHQGLMESQGHRKNILQPEFGKIGIGVIDGGIYGKMFTQVFTD